jgi:uncharacterized protein (DUF1697 family)
MQYIAFLRAINITGRFVRMERLRRVFKEMGFSNIETRIQSGNVSFESDDPDTTRLENQIEFGLQDTLGYPVPAFIRTDKELIGIVEQNPFVVSPAGENVTLYVVFLHKEPPADIQQGLLKHANETDRLHFFQNHLFWLYNRSVGESTFSNAKIEKILRAPATLRNISTLQKIAEKYR